MNITFLYMNDKILNILEDHRGTINIIIDKLKLPSDKIAILEALSEEQNLKDSTFPNTTDYHSYKEWLNLFSTKNIVQITEELLSDSSHKVLNEELFNPFRELLKKLKSEPRFKEPFYDLDSAGDFKDTEFKSEIQIIFRTESRFKEFLNFENIFVSVSILLILIASVPNRSRTEKYIKRSLDELRKEWESEEIYIEIYLIVLLSIARLVPLKAFDNNDNSRIKDLSKCLQNYFN
ncbi:MAG: hypothetical protein ACK481_03110 [Candidatus Melainabacteria bacterium]|jgi:hypothetical protein